MIRLWLKIIGGRPMKFHCDAFQDQVTGETVKAYYDQFGNPWLATNKWSMFRVSPKHDFSIWT